MYAATSIAQTSQQIKGPMATPEKKCGTEVCDKYAQPQPIQCSLTVGAPDDPLEHEADAMADTVMRMPDNNFIQRKCAHCEEEEKVQREKINDEEETVQRKPLASSITPFIQRKTNGEAATSTALTSRINNSRGSGTSMDGETRSFMETRFASDFSSVKIHTGNESVMMNRELNAKAFTVGNDIYFNEGQYNPGSNSGKQLLAHELTHTIQQGKGIARKIQRQTTIGPLTNAPANWGTQVAAATTSAQKAALIQTVLGSSVTVVDVTAASAADTVPTPAHLRAFSSAARVINFDEHLQSKRAAAGGRLLNINAGYTLHSGSSNYVILSNAALDASDYYQVIFTLNHEFDHLNQHYSGSILTGNASELDAWTSSFIREFEHSYTIRVNSGSPTCYVDRLQMYAPLSMYYQLLSGNTAARSAALQRIQTYYTSRLRADVVLNQVFILWVYNSMRGASNPDLGNDLNTALSLSINAAAGRRTYSQFTCSPTNTATAGNATAPSLVLPNFPTVAPAPPVSPKP